MNMSDQPQGAGVVQGLHRIVGVEMLENMLAMGVDRGHAYVQEVSDFLAQFSLRDEPQDLHFPVRQDLVV